MAKRRYHFIIPILLLLSIMGSFVCIVYNLKYYHDNLWEEISTNQLPIYAADQLVVDEKGNYYIGSYYNEYIQVFDSKGNYKFTISISGGRSNNFTVNKNKLLFILYGEPIIEYTIDLDKREVISEREIDDKSDDIFAMYSQVPPMVYGKGNKTYKLERSLFLLNKISITEGDKIETVRLKNVPKFPIITPFWMGLIVLSFWGLALYTHIVLHSKQIKEKIETYKEKMKYYKDKYIP